jgi:hypothetical protein
MTTDFKTDTEVLIIAMRHWAKVVLSNGGVAADTISQGADRLQELQARAEMAEASAKLWEADALRYANNTEFWQSRAEKAEAALADHITALEIANRSADEQMRYKREAEKLWKEFITLMEITEESDSGYEFNPNKISSCRAMDGKRLNEILVEARGIVFDAPKE